MVKAIEKAILTSDIGINPSNDGTDYPSRIPGADRGAQKRSRKGGKEER